MELQILKKAPYQLHVKINQVSKCMGQDRIGKKKKKKVSVKLGLTVLSLKMLGMVYTNSFEPQRFIWTWPFPNPLFWRHTESNGPLEKRIVLFDKNLLHMHLYKPKCIGPLLQGFFAIKYTLGEKITYILQMTSSFHAILCFNEDNKNLHLWCYGGVDNRKSSGGLKWDKTNFPLIQKEVRVGLFLVINILLKLKLLSATGAKELFTPAELLFYLKVFCSYRIPWGKTSNNR